MTQQKIITSKRKVPFRPRNPYAIYVNCDGAMDYDSNNAGGIGYYITFPDFVAMEPIGESLGSYHDSGIERLEIFSIIKGMSALAKLYETECEC